jgi:DNA-3-methyladenine glycosylase II
MTQMPVYQLASQHLSAQDADWARLITEIGDCKLAVERHREPYESLVRAIAYQQLNGRAAEAILGRFLALFPASNFPTPAQVLATDDATMRACGFSANKMTTIREIAINTQTGVVPTLADAHNMENAALIERLVQLRGVGRWTVEMFLIFTLGRMDVLPVGDFGIREGYKLLKSLSEQPTPKVLDKLGQVWAPYRSVATWYLWQAASLYKQNAQPKP